MIPRVCYFYWTGGPLPWLRAQSMATFARHNPGWRVVLGSPQVRDPPPGVELELDSWTPETLHPAARSDCWRWWTLIRGGLYSDTDVLFTGPVGPLLSGDHDAWVTQDGGHVVPGTKRGWSVHRGRKVPNVVGLSIGLLAAAEGSQFFSRVHALATAAPASGDYQSHGTSLLASNWARLTRGLSVGAIPHDLIYGGSSDEDVRAIWRHGSRPPDGAVAVHWYGGSLESSQFAGAGSTSELPDCSVRAAL